MRFIKTTRFWIFVFVGVLIFSAIAMFFFGSTATGSVAVITLDGEVIDTIDLSAVTNPYSFTVYTDDGDYNIINVEKGKICVCEANCPDQVCVNKGYITNSASPIVCLPNKLIIAIEPDGDDSVADIVTG